MLRGLLLVEGRTANHYAHYEKHHNPSGFTNIQALVMECSTTHISPLAWDHLNDLGCHPPDPSFAYSMLVMLQAQSEGEQAREQVQRQLKESLDTANTAKDKSRELWRLLQQLKIKRKLSCLRTTTGQSLHSADAIAHDIPNKLKSTMQATGASEDACRQYLHPFFHGKNTQSLFRMLTKPIDLDLIQAALLSLHPTSSPGEDGFTAQVYRSFLHEFAPVMLRIVTQFLADGTLPQQWTTALLNPIPKGSGVPTAGDLRPLVLQNVALKWLAASISLHLKDLIIYLTPLEQKGFIRGRYMFDHLYESFGSWRHYPEAAFLPIDFSKAFDSVTHTYCSVFFQMMGLPQGYVPALLHLFQAPIKLLLPQGIMHLHGYSPTSGVRQGCPLSPILFSMLISPIIAHLRSLNHDIRSLLYADDLLIILPFPQHLCVKLIHGVLHELALFTRITGLRVNFDKSAILLKGTWNLHHKSLIHSLPIAIKPSAKYLGVLLGNATPEESFAPALQKALHRAVRMQEWGLTLQQRIELLKQWILPVLTVPARVIFPTKAICAQLADVYRIALKLNPWGITLPILGLPVSEGGFSLMPPKSFLMWQHASMFLQYVKEPATISNILAVPFKHWAQRYGVHCTSATLPFFSMGPVPYSTMPTMAYAAKAYSVTMNLASPTLPAIEPALLPLWHNRLFSKSSGRTYYSPSLIRKNVLFLRDIVQSPELCEALPHTWKSVYRLHKRKLLLLRSSPPAVHHVPSFWFHWQSSAVSRELAKPNNFCTRQSRDTWKALMALQLPDTDRHFLYRALWRKLPTGQRQARMNPGQANCPIDGVPESHKHLCTDCRFLKIAFDCINKAYAPIVIEGNPISSVSALVWDTPSLSLSTAPGLLAWSAIVVNWGLRTSARIKGFTVTWENFLTGWVKKLATWQQYPLRWLPTAELSIFTDCVLQLLEEGKLVHPNLSCSANLPRPRRTGNNAKMARKLAAKQEFASQLEGIVAQGLTQIYTDGSSERVLPIGYIGGYGVHVPNTLDLGAPMPAHLPQTNNATEVYAVTQGLKIFPQANLALMTDCALVYLGATGAARIWKIRGWHGSHGPILHPELWEELLQLIAGHQGILSWYKVPSHVQIEGNERANDLAEWGRQQNSLYPEPPGDREEGGASTEANHNKVIIFSHKHPSPPEPAERAGSPPPPVEQEPSTPPCATPSAPMSGTQSDTHNMVTPLVTPIRVPVSASPLCRDTPARLLLNELDLCLMDEPVSHQSGSLSETTVSFASTEDYIQSQASQDSLFTVSGSENHSALRPTKRRHFNTPSPVPSSPASVDIHSHGTTMYSPSMPARSNRQPVYSPRQPASPPAPDTPNFWHCSICDTDCSGHSPPESPTTPDSGCFEM